MLTLTGRGGYTPSERSTCFPMLPLEEVERVLSRREELDETSLIREFQGWVRRSLRGA